MQAITYPDAMRLAREAYEADWLAVNPGGTFHADPEGYEDEAGYLVPVYDPDMPERLGNQPAIVVDKLTGEVGRYPMPESLGRVQRMRPLRR